MLVSAKQRGDTMIEVLLAATIFSMVAVAGLTIMNQGSAAAQRSLEVTLVRHEIDSQADALRLMYDEMIAQRSTAGYSSSTVSPSSAAGQWNAIINSKRKASASAFSDMIDSSGVACVEPASIDRVFVVNANTLTVTEPSSAWQPEAPLYSRVLYSTTGNNIASVDGLWVEAVEGSETTEGGITTPGYTDFHIRACWGTVGQNDPVTLGTIVRFYEP